MGAVLAASCQAPASEGLPPLQFVPTPPEKAAAAPLRDECRDLIPILAADTPEGVARERAWLEQLFPGAAIVSTTGIDCAGVPADRVVFVQDGVERVVVFDTSSFFGKVEGDDLNELLDG
ncbi:hypothetical protein [Parvularcula oceani]|uniref:hypothetical protein n=1 Tax=Parvularcula oceani TaxID=1247963 RepID=UPI0004E174BD|nr:hypothetical protein [Parvularcula oceani]